MFIFYLYFFFSHLAAGDGSSTQRRRYYIDVQKLENEFILTSAEYLLSLANIKWTFAGIFHF